MVTIEQPNEQPPDPSAVWIWPLSDFCKNIFFESFIESIFSLKRTISKIRQRVNNAKDKLFYFSSFLVSRGWSGMVLMIRWYDHMAVGQYGTIGIDGNG